MFFASTSGLLSASAAGAVLVAVLAHGSEVLVENVAENSVLAPTIAASAAFPSGKSMSRVTQGSYHQTYDMPYWRVWCPSRFGAAGLALPFKKETRMHNSTRSVRLWSYHNHFPKQHLTQDLKCHWKTATKLTEDSHGLRFGLGSRLLFLIVILLAILKDSGMHNGLEIHTDAILQSKKTHHEDHPSSLCFFILTQQAEAHRWVGKNFVGGCLQLVSLLLDRECMSTSYSNCLRIYSKTLVGGWVCAYIHACAYKHKNTRMCVQAQKPTPDVVVV